MNNNPNQMEDTYITPDMTMRFIIWSYYYHDIKPQKDVSYASYGLFAESDVDKLDFVKAALFKCYEEASLDRACLSWAHAKSLGEQCPYSQEELDEMFAKPQK